MDYASIYCSIIDRARLRDLIGYKEKHHIVPRCMGGSDEFNNLVNLTAREHFLCHWLLARLYPMEQKISYAFWAMCNQNSNNQCRITPSSRAYAEAKLAFSQAHRGRLVTDGTKKKLSQARAGKHSPKSAQFIQKLLESGEGTRFKQGESSKRKGVVLSEETIKKRSEAREGYKTSEATKQKISLALKGKPKPPRSSDWKQKQSLAKKGKPREKFLCQCCGRFIGGLGNYKKHKKVCFSD